MAARRNTMVQRQLVDRGLVDQRVLKAMGEVPRERFVPRNLRRRSYDDGPLPIAEGQTISQPFIVAAMTESAQVAPSDRALEIGTGSGYGAAVLSRVAADVVSVERHGLLAKSAADLLASLGYDNVTVVTDDGSLGYADGAPYDVIIVTAAGYSSGCSTPSSTGSTRADGRAPPQPMSWPAPGSTGLSKRQNGWSRPGVDSVRRSAEPGLTTWASGMNGSRNRTHSPGTSGWRCSGRNV